MTNAPLMPMATAVWLVENTTLTFKQIAEFCNLHEVEIQGIADDEVAKGIVGYNPLISGQLSREEIRLSSEDQNRPLNLKINEVKIESSEKKIKKYVPLSKRQDKPDSALWIIRQHSILKDSQIAKLIGITKNSVASIRKKSYWNYNNLNAKDPVAMGLFSQKDLMDAIEKAESVLNKVGMYDRREYYPSHISGGQQQRAAIARVLAMEPEVMLFDEPTSALDPELVGEVLKVMRALADEGRTMIVVTHEIGFARDVSNKVIFLHEGAIESEGTPAEMFGNPESERFRQFLSNALH